MTDILQLHFRKLYPDALLPRRLSDESPSYDLHAYAISETGRPLKRLIPPHSTQVISTGIALESPPHNIIMVCSRSGLAKLSVFVANAPGILNPDYRGEITVLLYNGGFQSYYIQHEDRIAKLIVLSSSTTEIMETKHERSKKNV
jgi:dUTP pyrophosphatase